MYLKCASKTCHLPKVFVSVAWHLPGNKSFPFWGFEMQFGYGDNSGQVREAPVSVEYCGGAEPLALLFRCKDAPLWTRDSHLLLFSGRFIGKHPMIRIQFHRFRPFRQFKVYRILRSCREERSACNLIASEFEQ